MTREHVLLLTESSKWGDLAKDMIALSGANIAHVAWSWGEDRSDLDAHLRDWRGDYIVCFKADCIVPRPTLAKTSIAINFHPGPPWLRGVACPERALGRGDLTYGVTCHHMLEEVDAGKIISVDTFDVPSGQTVATLREHVGLAMLCQLERVWRRRCALTRPAESRDPIWTRDLMSVREAQCHGLI